MKIGIVTHWMAVDNYGGMLQSYALQRYLRNLGHDAYLIRFFIDKKKQQSLSVRIKESLKVWLIRFNLFPNSIEIKKEQQNRKLWIAKRKFDEFRSKYIALSPKVYNSIYELKNNPPEADIYITGSDQVWAGDLNNPNIWIFYLDFGDETAKRLSYAASFGFSYFPGKDEEKFKELLNSFDAISVREANGVDICKKFGFEVSRCVDSTFLLKKEQYISIMSPRKHNETYAFFYTVNVSTPGEIYWNVLRDYLSSHGIESVVTTGSGYYSAGEIFDNALYDYATVEEWISNIYYSKVVITSSFHGIAFSIILNKDFVYLPLKGTAGGGNNRIVDLLGLLGLEDRQAHSFEDVKTLLNKKIDYNSVDTQKYQQLIVQSNAYLEAFLG